RITSENKDSKGNQVMGAKGPMLEGTPEGHFWFTEKQFASFVHRDTGKFNEAKWRSWAAVPENFQASARNEGNLRIHTYEIKKGESVEARRDYIGPQNYARYDSNTGRVKTESNVSYIGGGEQT